MLVKNIKFPRGNYQTDSFETETLYCLCCSSQNYLPPALMQKRGSSITLFNSFFGMKDLKAEIIK